MVRDLFFLFFVFCWGWGTNNGNYTQFKQLLPRCDRSQPGHLLTATAINIIRKLVSTFFILWCVMEMGN